MQIRRKERKNNRKERKKRQTDINVKEKVYGCEKCKEQRASGKLAGATVGPKFTESLKINLPDFVFLKQNDTEISKNFGENLGQIPPCRC